MRAIRGERGDGPPPPVLTAGLIARERSGTPIALQRPTPSACDWWRSLRVLYTRLGRTLGGCTNQAVCETRARDSVSTYSPGNMLLSDHVLEASFGHRRRQ